MSILPPEYGVMEKLGFYQQSRKRSSVEVDSDCVDSVFLWPNQMFYLC